MVLTKSGQEGKKNEGLPRQRSDTSLLRRIPLERRQVAMVMELLRTRFHRDAEQYEREAVKFVCVDGHWQA